MEIVVIVSVFDVMVVSYIHIHTPKIPHWVSTGFSMRSAWRGTVIASAPGAVSVVLESDGYNVRT
jgi:hypothetical protein